MQLGTHIAYKGYEEMALLENSGDQTQSEWSKALQKKFPTQEFFLQKRFLTNFFHVYFSTSSSGSLIKVNQTPLYRRGQFMCI
jgi:hypothetical protein